MGNNNINSGGNNIGKGNAIDAYLKAMGKKVGGKVQLTPEQKEAIAKWFQEHKTPQNPEKIPGFHFEHTAQMKYGANIPTQPTKPTAPPEANVKYGAKIPTKPAKPTTPTAPDGPQMKYGANIPPKKIKIKIGGQEIRTRYGVNTGDCGKPPVTDHGTKIKYGVNTGTRYRLK